MRVERADLIDQMLLLCALDWGNRRCAYFGKTLLTKCLFKAELELQPEGVGSPSYGFFRWNYGPYSKQLQQDLGLLQQAGMVHGETRLTESGREMAAFLQKSLEGHPEWTTSAKSVGDAVQFFRCTTAADASAWSHALRVRPVGWPDEMTVHDMPSCWDILTPREDPDWRAIDVPTDVLEVFAYARALRPEDLKLMQVQSTLGVDDLLAM